MRFRLIVVLPTWRGPVRTTAFFFRSVAIRASKYRFMRLKYHNSGKSRDYLLLHNILDAILGRFVRQAHTIKPHPDTLVKYAAAFLGCLLYTSPSPRD